MTVVTATDGNHGKSVAWGAQQFGCKCKIYLHAEVSQMREKAISTYGCDIVRIEGNYDDSVRHADKDAQNNGWYVVSDTSYEGYREVPSVVMQGYTTIATEIAEQILSAPNASLSSWRRGRYRCSCVVRDIQDLGEVETKNYYSRTQTSRLPLPE